MIFLLNFVDTTAMLFLFKQNYLFTKYLKNYGDTSIFTECSFYLKRKLRS